jgi:hypothetical protein
MRDGIGLLSRFEMRTMVLICRPQFDRAVEAAAMAFETWRRREVAGGDPHYVLYAVRVPAEARLDHDALVALGNDDEFGAALAAWLKMRARGISE